MDLTVLGNPDRYLAPLAGGSSYLLEAGGARILLDAGQGAREALEDAGAPELDAVWISHLHFDHVADLVALRGPVHEGTRILVPRGERARLDALAHAYAWSGRFEMGAGIEEVEATDALRVGDVALSFARTQHSAPSMALRAEHGGRAVVYASDTAPCEGLRRLARGASLLLMHTLLPTVDADSDHARVHATAQTAARLAEEVGADRLLLSHRYHESPDAAMREAASVFRGAELARRARYEV